MHEAERRAQKIKLTHELSRMSEELKKIEFESSESLNQIKHAEQELASLTSELTRSKSDFEQKKRTLEHGSQFSKPSIFDQRKTFGVELHKTQEPLNHVDIMNKKLMLEREYAQKEREVERKTIELKSKINTLTQKHNILERSRMEENAKKQKTERDLYTLEQEEILAKRIGAQKIKSTGPKEFSAGESIGE